MPVSGKLSGGFTRRNARTSSAKACSSVVKPKSIRNSDRQGYEWVAPEPVVDHPLHLVHGGLRLALEPEREIGVGVGRAHESPSPVEEDTRAVGLDRLVAVLERAGELCHDLELLLIGTGRLQLGRVVEMGQGIEVARDRLGTTRA